MATKVNRKKRLRKHLSSISIAVVVLMLLVFVSFASLRLRTSNEKKQQKIEELEALISKLVIQLNEEELLC